MTFQSKLGTSLPPEGGACEGITSTTILATIGAVSSVGLVIQ